MKREYDRLLQSDLAFAAAMRKREEEQAAPPDDEAHDFLTRLIERQKAGDERQNARAGTLCRGIMTFVMRKATGASSDDMDPWC